MDSMEILDEAYNTPSVIIDETKLSKDYLPKYLRFRDDHLKALARNFRGILESQVTTNRVIITGSVGVGKTSLAKKLGEWIEARGPQHHVNIRYIHINCRRAKTPFMILLHIVKELNQNIANRGFAADELLEMIIELIEAERINLVLVLDEVEYIIPKGGIDLLYALTRTADDRNSTSHQLGLILIAKNTHFFSFLDESTTSSLTAPVIHVAPYSKQELQQILHDRIDECFLPNSVLGDSVELIADIAAKKDGDARHALELLQIAAKLADLKGSKIVYPEHVRSAKENIDPSLLRDVIIDLSLHKVLLLLGIIRLLKHNFQAYITTGAAKESYEMVCEEYSFDPRKHTQMWEYLRELELHGIVNAELSGEGHRGNTQLISISDTSLEQLEEEVNKRLNYLLKQQ